MKKNKLGLAVLSLLSLSLIACGNNNNSATEKPNNSSTNNNTQLKDTTDTATENKPSVSVIPEEEMTGGIVMTLDETGSYFIVTDYLSVEYDIVIPDVYQGKPVREIGEAAFRYRTIDSLTLPGSLRKIGKDAFLGLSSDSRLTDLVIPEGVEEIDDGAFLYCPTLTSVSLPKSLKKLGSGVFHLDSSIKKIKVAHDSEYFLTENNILYSKDKKSLYVYPAGLNFTSFDLPKEVERIENYAFYGNKVLTAITIPANSELKVIGFRSLAAITNLNNLRLEKATKLTEIGELALSEDPSLLKITLPASLTKLSSGLFKGDSHLVNVVINGAYTEIPDECFNQCAKLTSVTLNNAITKIGKSAFYSCVSLAKLDLPESIEEIGEEAFGACVALKSIKISKKVTKIADRAFANCRALTTIDLGENITEIGTSAFNGCSSLGTIDLSKTKITELKETTFMSCSGMHEVFLPETLLTIGKSAFNSCSELRRVLIPSHVTTIGESAFYSCKKLKYVYLPKSVKSIGTIAFRTIMDLEGTVNLYFEAASFTNENTECGDNYTNGKKFFSKTISDFNTDSAGSLA